MAMRKQATLAGLLPQLQARLCRQANTCGRHAAALASADWPMCAASFRGGSV